MPINVLGMMIFFVWIEHTRTYNQVWGANGVQLRVRYLGCIATLGPGRYWPKTILYIRIKHTQGFHLHLRSGLGCN